MPKVTSNGIDIAYQVHGEGRPLVLIAGIGYGSWFWHWIVPALARDHRVVTFDNRGAGESDQPAGPYTVPMLAEDTAGLLDALGIEGAIILGHSLGGYIAQELAVSRGDLVGRLILASTNAGGKKMIPITPEALEVLTNRTGDPQALIRRGIDIACAPDFAVRQPGIVQELIAYRLTNPVPPPQYQAQVVAGAGMGELSDDVVTARLAAIKCPVLILFGAHDLVVPPGNAEMMAAQLSDVRVKIIPDTGHLFPIENPGATVNAIRGFLQPGSNEPT